MWDQSPDATQKGRDPRIDSAVPAFDEVLLCESCDSRRNYTPTIRTGVYYEDGDISHQSWNYEKRRAPYLDFLQVSLDNLVVLSLALLSTTSI